MLGYRADLHAADRPSKPPRVARHGGRRYFGYGQPHRQGYGLCLRFVGVMNASDRQDVKPTRHASAQLRSPRHSAQPVMPLGFVVVTWRRSRASARTYGLSTRLSPRHARTPGWRYFDYGQVHRRGYAQCLRFVDTVARRMHRIVRTRPTRHALASKPTSSTEWQLGTLNGLSWSGLTRGLTSSGWTAGCVEPRYDKAMRLRCRASAGLQFELQRHLQIHPLRDFVFVVAAGAVVVGTKLQTAPHARWPWA